MGDVCEEQDFILGQRVAEFEKALAEFIGCSYSVGVASGSDALLLSLMAIGVKAGDEVITTPFTFFATAGVVSRLHATPVFVDIKPNTFNINSDQLVDKISSRTKAIMPVHLFGQCAEIEKITEVANQRGVKVVEDACQAIGAVRYGVKAGALAHMGCFSFFPSKNLGGVGDGGLITTNDESLRDLLLALRVHGSRSDYHHDHIGINSRLDAIQASVLHVKLQFLNQWNQQRRENARKYTKFFEEAGLLDRVTLPWSDPANLHVFNQYTIQAQNRDQLMAHLREHDIGHKVYYPVPLHLQECYQSLGYKKGDFPVAEQMAQVVLSLPIYPELTDAHLTCAVDTIRDFYAST